MRIGSRRGTAALLLLPLLGLSLSGCGSLLTEGTAVGAGIAGAGAASAVTKNAAVGAAIGLGVAAGANAGLLYVERSVHTKTQDSIAATAGPLPEGGVAKWSVSHRIPIELPEHGEVAVSHEIDGPDFACKEIVFSVDATKDGKVARNFFTAYICRDGQAWRWATAEPATARWGALQ